MVANPAAIAPPTATSLLLKANPALATSLLMKVVPQTAAKALTVKNAAAIKAAAAKRARHAATAQARVTAQLTPDDPRVKTALHLVLVPHARHAPSLHTQTPARPRTEARRV